MNCHACKLLLGEYIDGELPESEHQELGRHIRRCNACRQEVEFLERLSRDAAGLQKDIQPGRDLWPAIEAEISAQPREESSQRSNESRNDERKERRRKTAAWWWPIAAAIMIGLLVMAGAYLLSPKQPVTDSKTEGISAAIGKEAPAGAGSTLTRSPGTRRGAAIERATEIVENGLVRDFTSDPLDPFDRVFVSNYGIYVVRQDFDPSSGLVRKSFVLQFDRDGLRPWVPPVPVGSMLLSVYPGEGNRLSISYEIRKPQFHCEIASLDFGIDSQSRSLFKSSGLHVSGFVTGPNGLIYAAGFQNDYRKAVSKLAIGQSVTTEFLHIIDPQTGDMLDLFPVTLYRENDSQAGAGQTLQNMSSFADNSGIAVKSNGNFFVTTDVTSTLPAVRGLIKNEAVEYSPDGVAAKKWDLGILEPDAYLNKIFVDIDDSMLAEIIRYPDLGGTESLDQTLIERYLLRVEPDGRVTSYKPALYPNESIRGWIGKTQELVTVINEAEIKRISIHRIPF